MTAEHLSREDLDDLDALCAADIDWFERHPDADYYWRPARPSEIRSMCHLRGHDPADVLDAKTKVSRIPGGRRRQVRLLVRVTEQNVARMTGGAP